MEWLRRFESTYAGMNDPRVRGQDACSETRGRARPDALHRYHSFKSLVQFQLYLLPVDLTSFVRQDRHGPRFVDVEGGETFCPKSQSPSVAKVRRVANSRDTERILPVVRPLLVAHVLCVCECWKSHVGSSQPQLPLDTFVPCHL